ncbi:MAG: 2,3-bisphosphoglycerate-independent phosphoglycerate mutase [bacterium]|nr:2,3-bisphosphoglycerate-independent phosphoglycerate mutase [bacterium]
MDFRLERLKQYEGVRGPLLLVILDGMGLYRGRAEGYPGNAIDLAQPANLYRLLKTEKIVTKLKAHGTAVGMPSDADQGNSEVGHNAIGAGRVFSQGARLVDEALASGRLFEGAVWQELIRNAVRKGTPVHFIGLVSDGNVHSHLRHLLALITECDKSGVEEVYVHGLLDGRDVPPLSALRYFGELEDALWALRVKGMKDGKRRRYFVASGGGRMVTTMDRYEADWRIVERGYHAHVMGEGPLFPDSLTAIRVLRAQTQQEDQYLPHWVVEDPERPGKPVGEIFDDHQVVMFNFRGDRAIEISRAFVEKEFKGFVRRRWPQVLYAGMMEYDGDTHMPPRYLVDPPAIERTISEYLAHNNVTQFALSETQKYGHVTYFWNGNNSMKFNEALETWVEIPSDKVPFDQAPGMKAREIAAETIKALRGGKYKFLRINFANGDMVGHTGSLVAAVEAVKVVDEALGQLIACIDEVGGTLVVTADHGNCEQMYAVDKKTGAPIQGPGGSYEPLTSHTLNPVPFIIHGPDTARYELNTAVKEPGLANIAATLLNLLGFEKPADYYDSLICIR